MDLGAGTAAAAGTEWVGWREGPLRGRRIDPCRRRGRRIDPGRIDLVT
jgi:hypothetical protein